MCSDQAVEALVADDTLAMVECLAALGVDIEVDAIAENTTTSPSCTAIDRLCAYALRKLSLCFRITSSP